MALDREGILVFSAHGSEPRLHKPVVYQELNGQRKAIDGHFALKAKTRAGFHVAAWD